MLPQIGPGECASEHRLQTSFPDWTRLHRWLPDQVFPCFSPSTPLYFLPIFFCHTLSSFSLSCFFAHALTGTGHAAPFRTKTVVTLSFSCVADIAQIQVAQIQDADWLVVLHLFVKPHALPSLSAQSLHESLFDILMRIGSLWFIYLSNLTPCPLHSVPPCCCQLLGFVEQRMASIPLISPPCWARTWPPRCPPNKIHTHMTYIRSRAPFAFPCAKS
jgi:hypothetical protein